MHALLHGPIYLWKFSIFLTDSFTSACAYMNIRPSSTVQVSVKNLNEKFIFYIHLLYSGTRACQGVMCEHFQSWKQFSDDKMKKCLLVSNGSIVSNRVLYRFYCNCSFDRCYKLFSLVLNWNDIFHWLSSSLTLPSNVFLLTWTVK